MNNQSNTVAVEYIGLKKRKEDNVSDSGAVWNGHGDVQLLTPAQWGKLQRHPEVWRMYRPPEEPLTSIPTLMSLSGHGASGEISGEAIANAASYAASTPETDAQAVVQAAPQSMLAAAAGAPAAAAQDEAKPAMQDHGHQPAAAEPTPVAPKLSLDEELAQAAKLAAGDGAAAPAARKTARSTKAPE